MEQLEDTLEFGIDGSLEIAFDCSLNEVDECYDVEAVRCLSGEDLPVFIQPSAVEEYLQQQVNTLGTKLRGKAEDKCGVLPDETTPLRRDYYSRVAAE